MFPACSPWRLLEEVGQHGGINSIVMGSGLFIGFFGDWNVEGHSWKQGMFGMWIVVHLLSLAAGLDSKTAQPSPDFVRPGCNPERDDDCMDLGVCQVKITKSSSKLATWAWIRALDKAAMVLIRQGIGVEEAYRKALEASPELCGGVQRAHACALPDLGGGPAATPECRSFVRL